jgi:predicted tellurium resistance membrane protein TerC
MNVSTDEKSDYSKNLVNTGQWFLASTVVCGIISKIKGVESSIEFASGYFLEQALSIDNLFVFILIFKYFKIPKELEQKVLNYGILGGTIYVIYISRLRSILFNCLNF